MIRRLGFAIMGLLVALGIVLVTGAERPDAMDKAKAPADYPIKKTPAAPPAPIPHDYPRPPRVRLSTMQQAYQAALIDLYQRYPWYTNVASVLPGDESFIRWVWIDNGEREDAMAMMVALQAAARSGSVLARPVLLQAGDLLILRIDLRQYAVQLPDLLEWVRFWEDFQFEPKASLLLTRKTQPIIVASCKAQKRPMPTVKRKRMTKGKDGKEEATDELIPIDKLVLGDADVVRLQTEHVDPVLIDKLTKAVSSQGPVVSHHYLLQRIATTIKTDVAGGRAGLWNDLYGGRYYELKGIKRGASAGRAPPNQNSATDGKGLAKKRRKVTDLDRLISDRLFVGNIKGELFFDVLLDAARSDYATILEKSDVTGKWRRVRLFHGPLARDGTGRIAITDDVRDTSIDIDKNPFFNVVVFDPDAHELIAEDEAGFNLFALFNGDGELVDEVPGDVALDTTIPDPYTKRLQPMISCIRCHGADGSDGWKPLRNDFATVLQRYGDVYGDRALADRPLGDQINRIAGLYKYPPLQLRKSLARARNDYADQILLCAGAWDRPDPKGKPVSVVKRASARIGEIYADYWYTPIDAARALRELGIPAGDDGAVSTLRRLTFPDLPPGVPYVEQDPRLQLLLSGVKISRIDFDQAYGFLAARCYSRYNWKPEKNTSPLQEGSPKP